MTPDVSIVTAATRPERLGHLYRSIVTQSVEWEWVVQLDGEAIAWQPGPAEEWMADPRVRLDRNPKSLGSGTTRNQALMRSSAAHIMCVDDDDQIPANSVHYLLAALGTYGDCFGAWGETRSFSDDPSRAERFKFWPKAGRIAPTTVLSEFEESGHFPVHVGAMLWRRSHLVAVGGYAALPRSVDTNPFLACEALFSHVYVDEVTYLYRLHADQMTKEAGYLSSKERVHAINFERAHALRELLRPRS
jgi:glycosyltransferase involved in cell wall biosynthesis